MTSAANCDAKSVVVIPSNSPNKIRARSPTNEDERDVIMTPSASMPTNSKPIAVSPDNLNLRVTMLTPPIMTAAPTAAPRMPENPSNIAVAIPGSTPWASASPTNAKPRNTTNVPAIAHVKATRIPPNSASRMNSLLAKGSTR